MPARRPTVGTGDEVDALVAAWRRERPDVAVDALEVLSRVSRLARLLDRERSRAFGRHGLEGWEFDVLAALRRSGPPYELSPTALVRAALVTSGTMTNRVDRLVAAGLVERRPDPTDGRGVRVRLTDAGREAVDRCLVDLVQAEEALLAPLSPRDREQVAAALRRLLVGLEGAGG